MTPARACLTCATIASNQVSLLGVAGVLRCDGTELLDASTSECVAVGRLRIQKEYSTLHKG